ncbi:MAG: isoprenyl transferase [Clostridiales bacterium]|nr:isoprenyl transferase [Clostridiales bacterium]
MTNLPKLPAHVAIIMDGNGRWARQHALSVMRGHRQGVEALREIIRYSSDIGIQVLSLYAFSTENWSRPEAEVAALMRLIVEFFHSEIDELHQNQVRIRILGDVDGLTQPARQAVLQATERTAQNTGLQLNIALNYGAHSEMLRAVRLLLAEVQSGALRPDQVDLGSISQRLYTAGQPQVDLLIRTSGEQRLSNFLLFQSAYAELLFPDILWPDFTVAHYKEALATYGGRDRRFGGRKA